MNANCCEFSAAQKMSRIYALRSRGCHCHCQVVTAAPFSSSLVVLGCLCCLEVLCGPLSRTLLAALGRFYYEGSWILFSTKITGLATVANLTSIFASIFVLALAATWRQMPWQAARKHTGRARTMRPRLRKLFTQCASVACVARHNSN